jgi:ABC-type amino acid transport substrate-binding protein
VTLFDLPCHGFFDYNGKELMIALRSQVIIPGVLMISRGGAYQHDKKKFIQDSRISAHSVLIVRGERFKRFSTKIILVLVFYLVPNSLLYAEDLVCGITTGFPPYQFMDEGRPVGFDADVIRLIAVKANLDLRFVVARWDDLLHFLLQGQINCITGMEMTSQRRDLFDFSPAYYERINAVFVRTEDTWIQGVEDLFNQRITGDRQSDIEELWTAQGFRSQIRIQQTDSKREAMQMLADRLTLAAIMPRGVGFYLAKQFGLEVRVLLAHPRGTPVALAVRKGDRALQETLNGAMEELIQEGAILSLYEGWMGEKD